MKKLNNKGYMIVEIIVSSIIAMTIAYFLFDLVIKLKEKYDYIQTDTVITADKIVVTNEILGNLYDKDIENACEIKDGGEVTFLTHITRWHKFTTTLTSLRCKVRNELTLRFTLVAILITRQIL